MSYSIQYGPKREFENAPKKARSGMFLAGGVLVLALGAVAFFPEGVEVLRLALFPWMNDVTAGALDALVANLTEGTDLVEDLAVFCREVIGFGAV